MNASVATKTNPLNLCHVVSCGCGRMCKSSMGLKVHQAKSKCQTPENKLKAPPKKCFVSLQDIISSSCLTFEDQIYFKFIISSSCLTFEDQIYFKTSEETFIPISGNNKSVSGNKCFVQTHDIIVNPLIEYLNNDINPCGQTSCRTCNIFISDRIFRRNLTGKEYKTITYDRLPCGSTNVIYGIHCVHCGLVYVGETGKSLRSAMNGPRSAIKKGGLLHRHFHQPAHSVDDMRVQILGKVYSSDKPALSTYLHRIRDNKNKTNDPTLNLIPGNITQHSGIE